MSNSRLVLVSLLAAVLVAPVAAQTSAMNTDSTNPDSKTAFQVPFAINHDPSDNSSQNIRVDQFRLSPNTSAGSQTETAFGLPYRLRAQHLQDQQSDTVCYSIRSYVVARDDPQSDTTRPAGYSTCQLSTRYRVKAAVDSTEARPRRTTPELR
jgi:hypothetical protein